MMERRVPGPIAARELGAGTWRLSTADGTEIYLRDAAAPAADILANTRSDTLRLEWHDGAVRVLLMGAQGVRQFEAGGAFMHEPRPLLYESLPLAPFDANARRFWGRVFRLMRIPGGRLLLRFLTRGRRGGRRGR